VLNWVAMDELVELVRRHAGGAGTPLLKAVRLTASDTVTAPLGSLTAPTLAVTLQGVKRTVLNDTGFEYGPGAFLVVTLELPVTAHIVEAPFTGVGLTLRPAAIAELLLSGPAPAPRGAPAGMAVSAAPPDLLDALGRLLRLLDRPEDAPALAPVYEREILWRLMTGEQGAAVRQIGLADSTLSLIGRSVGWIRAHHAEALRVEELARMVGMSVSSFHRHFRAVTAMTPIQYQKRIRLQEARTRLLSQPRDVAGVGFAVGYESPSQFSREYRRLFGVSPGKDAERMREAAAA
jgi:AraC-like DNA-binding protein